MNPITDCSQIDTPECELAALREALNHLVYVWADAEVAAREQGQERVAMTIQWCSLWLNALLKSSVQKDGRPKKRGRDQADDEYFRFGTRYPGQ
jgi:hypothetical protein